MSYYLAYLFIYGLIFIFGISIGSFLNVVIYRTEKELSFVKGRSICPSCNHQLSAKDLIPIFSYLALGRRCAYCKEKISPRYMIVELFTGIIFVFCFFTLGFSMQAIYVCILSSILICISLIDYDIMEIPDFLTMAVGIMGAFGLFVFWEIGVVSRVIGVVIISVPMYVLNKFIEGAFGEGDVFLIAACGLVLGWSNTVLAMFIAMLIGGIYAISLILRGKASKGAHISFGQYICIGTMVALIYGDRIIGMYLNYFGL